MSQTRSDDIDNGKQTTELIDRRNSVIRGQ